MLRFLLLTTICLGSSALFVGCGGDPEPTVTGPQAEGQKAKSTDEQITYMIKMLHDYYEDSPKKAGRAVRGLGKYGAVAAKALPDLQEIADKAEDTDLKEKCIIAIEQINQAVADAG